MAWKSVRGTRASWQEQAVREVAKCMFDALPSSAVSLLSSEKWRFKGLISIKDPSWSCKEQEQSRAAPRIRIIIHVRLRISIACPAPSQGSRPQRRTHHDAQGLMAADFPNRQIKIECSFQGKDVVWMSSQLFDRISKLIS